MKKFSIALLLIFAVLSFSSCGFSAPFQTRQLQQIQTKTFRIYVSGAVENEGYVELAEGSEWLDCVKAAGYISQTVMPNSPHEVICADGILILRYYDGANYCDCVNLNGPLVTERRSIENVSDEVVSLIADFIESNGKITDRTQLKSVLGDLYDSNFYKFFVSENDYEKVS